MGYESSVCAARRLRRLSDATRDAVLRTELLSVIAASSERVRPASPARPLGTSATGTAAMQTQPHDAVVASYASVLGERPATVASPPSLADVSFESVATPRLPVEHLVNSIACGDVVRELLASLTEQARAIALVREAHALGAATMPPEVAAALAAAADALPATLRGSMLAI